MTKKLTLALAAIAVFALAACGAPAAPAAPADPAAPAAPTAPAAPAPPAAGAGVLGEVVMEDAVEAEIVEGLDFGESPWFEGRGFPSVGERLPANPRIWGMAPEAHMTFQIGRYSSDPIRSVRMTPVFDGTVWSALDQVMIVNPGRLGGEFIPQILESFEISDDLMTFTFRLREGMRWSDGVPVTTEDAYFAWHYLMLDHRIFPATNSWFRAGGSPFGNVMEQEIIDRYTFRFISDEPYGSFAAWMAFSTYANFLQPAHHLRQFHIDLQDEDVLRGMVEDRGFIFPEEWTTFFQYMRLDTFNSGRTSQGVFGGTPSLGPWVLYQDGDVRVFQRNPFYWQVDPAGNQLPYIDYIHSHLVVDLAAATIRMLAGDVDHSYEWVPLPQVPLFAEHAAANNFRVLPNTLLTRTDGDILINQTYDCPRWRSVAQDIRFRQAISRAIDREEILEAVYFGFARVTDWNNPTHDMDEARALLADMGLAVGADGFLTPDGDPFMINFDYTTAHAQFGPTAIIVNEVMRELGFNVNFRQVDSALQTTMAAANEIQMTIHFNGGPQVALAYHWSFNNIWRLWHQYWETGGEAGEPMPPHVEDFYDAFLSLRRNHLRYIPAGRERIRQIMVDNYFIIFPVSDAANVSVVHEDLRNVPEVGFMFTGARGADAWWFDR